MNDRLTSVIVVGGGIAGLSVAYELTRRGVPFVLLERGPRAGGVRTTAQVVERRGTARKSTQLPQPRALAVPSTRLNLTCKLRFLRPDTKESTGLKGPTSPSAPGTPGMTWQFPHPPG